MKTNPKRWIHLRPVPVKSRNLHVEPLLAGLQWRPNAKGLLRAGLDAFAHSVRDRDIDDELMMLAKQRPALVVVPNLPDRGVVTDLSWLAE